MYTVNNIYICIKQINTRTRTHKHRHTQAPLHFLLSSAHRTSYTQIFFLACVQSSNSLCFSFWQQAQQKRGCPPLFDRFVQSDKHAVSTHPNCPHSRWMSPTALLILSTCGITRARAELAKVSEMLVCPSLLFDILRMYCVSHTVGRTMLLVAFALLFCSLFTHSL